MKNLKVLSLLAISAIAFVSCSKDDAPAPTTLQKLQGKWNYQKSYEHDFYGGTHYYDTTFATTGDYADFRTDGKVYFKFDTDFDTLNYALLGDNKIVVSYSGMFPFADTVDIQQLDNNNLRIYGKDEDLPDFYEFTEFYTR